MADQSGESKRIGGIIAGLMKAWNTHDMHAFAELFAEDASFVNVNGSWLERPDQIEAFHEPSIAASSRTASLRSGPPRSGSFGPTWLSCRRRGKFVVTLAVPTRVITS
jgi:uncharacterized protein (TIGR02246 family)